jgi:transposase-like protein
MKIHRNAKLHPSGRLLMCLRVIEQGWSLTEAAEAAGVSERTCSKWLSRYRSEGQAGLLDRSSAPSGFPTVRPSGSSRRSAPCGACG